MPEVCKAKVWQGEESCCKRERNSLFVARSFDLTQTILLCKLGVEVWVDTVGAQEHD